MRWGLAMTAASVTVSIAPKRILTRKEAAAYCGRSLTEFNSECPVMPIKFANGDLRYDARDLDAWLDNLKQKAEDSDAAIIERLGSK